MGKIASNYSKVQKSDEVNTLPSKFKKGEGVEELVKEFDGEPVYKEQLKGK